MKGIKMKNISKIIASFILIGGIFFSGCEDMLSTDTDRYLKTEDNQLGTANDTVYSLIGILRNFQELGDRYVILGELRADLMDVSENADLDLHAITNFTVTSDNPWVSVKEYYAVINNCNYFIKRADTAVVSGGEKVLLMEYAAIKAIRAWTYMQLALNFGKATYYEDPILTIEDMNKTYPEYTINELADILIQDLIPYEGIEYPEYGEVGENIQHDLRYFMLPVSFVLGDLYLWKGNYESAALKYYNLIQSRYASTMYEDRPSVISALNSSYWDDVNFNTYTSYWVSGFTMYENSISVVSYNNTEQDVTRSVMRNYTLPVSSDGETNDYKLIPSQIAMDNWDNEIYTYYDKPNGEFIYSRGDLRGKSITEGMKFGWNYYTNALSGSYGYYYTSSEDSVLFITKYMNGMSDYYSRVFLYRGATLYLRLAEALNNMGKPTLAFAVLKYGLGPDIVSDPNCVDSTEVQPLPVYANFNFIDEELYLTRNVDTDRRRFGGIHERGAGLASRDTMMYILPENASQSELIKYVDEKILHELALETAFEGNRFQDLMRFAIRRNDPSILANRVGAKNPSVQSKLMDPNNWYLPLPKE